MEELEILVNDTGALIDEIIGLMPDEPSTELEAKVGEFAAKVTQLLAQLSAIGAEEPSEEMDAADDAEEIVEE